MNNPLSSIRNVGGGAFGLAAAVVLVLALASADVLARANQVPADGLETAEQLHDPGRRPFVIHDGGG